MNFQERLDWDENIKSTTSNQTVTCDSCNLDFLDEWGAKRHQISDKEDCSVIASNNAKTNRHEEVGQMEHTGNPAVEELRGTSYENGLDSKCSKCNLEFTTAKALENHRTFDRELCSFAASKRSKGK